MKRLSALWARYRERQRTFAEYALKHDRLRFVWLQGVLYWAIFGLAMAIINMYHQRGHDSLLDWWNLAFLLFAPVFCGAFGYLWGHWKWKDYERMAKR